MPETGSRMRRYGDNREITFARPVAPEDPVGCRSVLLRISNEHFLISMVRMRNGCEFMSLEAWVPGIHLELPNALSDLLE